MKMEEEKKKDEKKISNEDLENVNGGKKKYEDVNGGVKKTWW